MNSIIIEKLIMQEILSSTSGSLDGPKWLTSKGDRHQYMPCQVPTLQANPENDSIYRKYNEFMNGQNRIINEVLLDNKAKYIAAGTQEEVMNRLRDSSNQFVKSLLSELTEAYSKLRTLKSGYDEKVAQLECELSQERYTSKLLRNQFYSSWEENSEQCEKYLQFVQKELKDTIQQYETKISEFLKEIEKKQQFCDRMYCEKLELNNQLSQANRVLRMERESLNQKCKQFKGMELLVAEYQNAIKDLELDKHQSGKRISELLEQVKQLQQYNKSLVVELNESDFKTSQKEEANQRISKMLQQQKLLSARYCQQLEHAKIKAEQDSIVQENNIILLRNNETSLKLEIELAQSKLTICEKQLKESREKLDNCYEELRKSKRDTKKIIAKIQLMFKSKQKLVKKAFKSELNKLRAQNQTLREWISRELFRFYQELRMDMLTSSIPESRSLVYSHHMEQL